MRLVYGVYGRVAALSCPGKENFRSASRPPPKIQWLRDGRPFTSSRALQMPSGDLQLKGYTVLDIGNYSCLLENPKLFKRPLTPEERQQYIGPIVRLETG